MSWGAIIGLFGGGLSLTLIAAAISFFAPQIWLPILETAQAVLKGVAKVAIWLVYTPEGRQALLAVLVAVAFWWSGQRGFDRGGHAQAQRDADRLAQAHANLVTLKTGLETCNASIMAGQRRGQALQAAGQRAADKAAGGEKAAAKAAQGYQAIKPGASALVTALGIATGEIKP